MIYATLLWTSLHRGSYISAHVLLILLNELGKRDKMRGLPIILSLFRNEFNKFNNHCWPKNVIILSLFALGCYERHNVSRKSVSIVLHGVISLPDATSYDT